MALSTKRYSVVGLRDAKLLTVSGGTITKTDILYVNTLSFEYQSREIVFEGDDSEDRRFQLTAARVTANFDKYDLRAISAAYQKQEVTSGLPTDEAWRLYFGDAQEVQGVNCGVEFVMEAKNEDTGLAEYLRMGFPVAKLSQLTPQSPGFNTKWGNQLVFEGQRSSLDLAGVALPSVPTGGAFWYLAGMNTGPT